MSGIDRLRTIAGAWDEWGLGGTLTEISDQIERELARHDEPDSTDNGARLLYVTDEDRLAAAWVREHGGLDAVKKEWNLRGNFKRQLEKAQEKVERQQRHIEFVQGKCHERLVRIAALNKTVAEMRPRLMPEGMEWLIEAWPRFDDGEPVRIGDDYECWCGETHAVCSVTIREGRSALNESHPHTFVVSNGPFTAHGKRVKRPAVLAADGEPMEVGQTVWNVEYGTEWRVTKVKDGKVFIAFEDFAAEECDPSLLTHQRPVLDADGVPIELGDDLYSVEGGLKLHVSNIDRVNCRIATSAMFALDKWADPSMFTHTKPEIDTWQRIEEDATLSPEVYCHRNGIDISRKDGTEIFLADTVEPMARDLVRRCRALAERERGE